MIVQRMRGDRQWGGSTAAQALASGYKAMGFEVVVVVPNMDHMHWVRRTFGTESITYGTFAKAVRSPGFREVSVLIFDDYALMPNGEGDPLMLLDYIERTGHKAPRNVFVFS